MASATFCVVMGGVEVDAFSRVLVRAPAFAVLGNAEAPEEDIGEGGLLHPVWGILVALRLPASGFSASGSASVVGGGAGAPLSG